MKYVFFLLILIVCCAAASAMEVNGRSGADNGKPLVIGFTHQVFYSVDPRDAMSLAKTWVNAVDRKLNNPAETKVIYLSSSQETESALTRDEVDIIVMLSEDFVRLRENFGLVPVLSADYGKRFYDELLLLVRVDSGITRLGQLRGKSLRIEGGRRGRFPRSGWILF
ncbi:MAG TPA: PhnD/SsuA/transferrin family substrate-binding protein [Geobacteraceae bacterium]|nr:PhnD/SsuA/transferrin family substrate-binding protein [Geobacteraceae bacterium]